MKKEIARVLLPIYTLLDYIEESNMIRSNPYVKMTLGPLLIIVFSMMTFIGIRRMNLSCTILFSEILFSGYLRMYEKILRANSNLQNDSIFYVLNAESLESVRDFLVKNQNTILIVIFIISCILGYISLYLTKIGRILMSLLITFYVRDNNWFKKLGILVGNSLAMEIIAHLVLLISLFIFFGYILKFVWAAIFSLVGSISLSVVLQRVLQLNMGMEALFDEDVPFFVIDPGNPAMLYTLSFFLLGLASQLIILK